MKQLLSYILSITFVCILPIVGYAQQKDRSDLQIQVKDKQSKELLEFALIYLTDGKQHWEAICNEEGKATINKLPKGNYRLEVSLLSYKKWQEEIIIDADKSLNVSLSTNSNELNEVVVTASESKGLTSSSIIDRRAMQHLQPSSFTDLLELLPGGKAKDPNFSSINTIRIREVGLSDSSTDYNVSSLGTSFVVDGVPISTDANMQYLSTGDATITGTTSSADSKRSSVNRGVDMRSISTDQIEKVEIVRGIPSVQYGDLTSGLVKIERKKGNTPWDARLKVDGYSKLFAVNKGYYFKDKKLTLNFGVDFLDSQINPTNSYENYQRLTYSIVMGRMEVSSEQYIADYTHEYSWTMVFNGVEYNRGPFVDYKIPNEWVMDAVYTSAKGSDLNHVFSPTIDAGWTYCGESATDTNRYGKCVRRKVLTTNPDGRKILKDTNNSAVDFIANATPSFLE